MLSTQHHSIGHHRSVIERQGNTRVLVVVILACLVAGAATLMTQEQGARTAAAKASDQLGAVLDAGDTLTPDEVHKKIGREPTITRKPAKHRYVEEYRWKGPISSYTVYAYYKTAATQLLEAVSMNQTLPDWENE